MVLGVDPGSRVVGYGLVEVRNDGCDTIQHVDHGCLTSTQEDPFLRWFELSQQLAVILDRHAPQVACLEQVFVGKNIKSAFVLGQARGALVIELVKRKMDITEYAPRSIKKGITGKGESSKEEVRFWVQQILTLPHLSSKVGCLRCSGHGYLSSTAVSHTTEITDCGRGH